MMMTAMAISPMMRNVLSVATMLPTDVMASDTATIAPMIVPMIRRMSPLCAPGPLAGHGRAFVILTLDQREMTGPGTGTRPADGRSSFRRILVPVRSPGESGQALAMAARLCGMTNGVLRLVHVRTYDPPMRSSSRFYWQTPGEAAAVLEEALLMAWACGGPRASTALIAAQRSHAALAIVEQACAW